MLPPKIDGVLRWGNLYAGQIMIGFLIIALCFMFIKQERLMFASFTFSAALALFLKFASNADIAQNVQESVNSFSVAHVNTEDPNSSNALIQYVREKQPEIISLEQQDSIAFFQLKDSLSNLYPFQCYFLNGNSRHGILLKKPAIKCDTFHLSLFECVISEVYIGKEVPNIMVCHVQYTGPSEMNLNEYSASLGQLSMRLNELGTHNIVVGDFNEVSWSEELRKLKLDANLKDSRRGYLPTYPNLFEKPVLQIFYSESVVCQSFRQLRDPKYLSMGIVGNYSWK